MSSFNCDSSGSNEHIDIKDIDIKYEDLDKGPSHVDNYDLYITNKVDSTTDMGSTVVNGGIHKIEFDSALSETEKPSNEVVSELDIKTEVCTTSNGGPSNIIVESDLNIKTEIDLFSVPLCNIKTEVPDDDNALIPVELDFVAIKTEPLAEVDSDTTLITSSEIKLEIKGIDESSAYASIDPPVEHDLSEMKMEIEEQESKNFNLDLQQPGTSSGKENNEQPNLSIDEVMKIVGDSTEVINRTVHRIINEYKQYRTISDPKQKKSSKIVDSVDDFDRHAIRRKIHEFYFKNELPTTDKVLEVINSDENLPTFKRSSFYKLLKYLNFKYVHSGRKNIVVDKDEIILWRRNYLKSIKLYREQGRKVYYVDETWINAGNTMKKKCMDETITSSRQATLSGLTPGLKDPSGKGKMLIICHIGSEDGFVPEGLSMFETKKSGDYHEEMNSESFEKWFSQILSKLDDNSVIVIDNAPCHSRKVEKIPTSATRKADIQSWLRSKNIFFEENILKAELLAIVHEEKSKYNKYVIDEMAQEHNKIVLRLPPYHYELNPIELIWSKIKNFVACQNTSFIFSDMKQICFDAVATIDEIRWKKCIQYVRKKVETRIWELDNIIETQMESITINANNSDISDSSD